MAIITVFVFVKFVLVVVDVDLPIEYSQALPQVVIHRNHFEVVNLKGQETEAMFEQIDLQLHPRVD